MPNRRHLRAIVRRFMARRGWLVRQLSGGESRDVWKVGPLCVKRWQPAIPPAAVRAKCRLSRRHPDFASRWYLPWLHWSIGLWIEGRQAGFEECNALACRYPWARDFNPSNVVATPRGLKVIDFEVSELPPVTAQPRVFGRTREFLRIARVPGGGESRDIWKFGPLVVKRWSQRVPPTEVRERCRVSRAIPVCNPMWYVPRLHWTVARWVVGEPASHETCNQILARFPELRDLHPGNVVAGRRGAVVVDSRNSSEDTMPTT
ncbi:MAG: hypothetical protein DCC67_17050 [Planctomycetota bacterium]|nr:MAG: hypothetical protein DCC67_17050 [Planctomycetota bacterium]